LAVVVTVAMGRRKVCMCVCGDGEEEGVYVCVEGKVACEKKEVE
jgi:hypothetical protein